MHLLVERAGGLLISKKPLYNYVMRPNSITTKAFSLQNFDYINSLMLRHEYLSEKYNVEEIGRIGRYNIFDAICRLANNIVQKKFPECLLNELNLVHNAVYNRYSYEDCGFSKGEIEMLRILESGLRQYAFANKWRNSVM